MLVIYACTLFVVLVYYTFNTAIMSIVWVESQLVMITMVTIKIRSTKAAFE